jgi:hypothetical protein
MGAAWARDAMYESALTGHEASLQTAVKYGVKFEANRNFKFVYPTNIRSTAARLLSCGFEYHLGHECLSVVIVVCCLVEVSALG